MQEVKVIYPPNPQCRYQAPAPTEVVKVEAAPIVPIPAPIQDPASVIITFRTFLKPRYAFNIVVIILLLAILTLLIARPAHGQEQNFGAGSSIGNYTVATLPSGPTGALAIVTDGNGYSCTSGSSTTYVLCYFTGLTWTPVGPTGSGSGSVTSFSSGDLSPIFTANVATPTTTPALTYTLSNASANLVFGNCTTGTTTPSYCSLTAAMIPSGIPIANIGSAGLSGTSPIAISAAGAISCATCVVASSPGLGLAHFAGSTQTVTSSLVVSADLNITTSTCTNQFLTAISATAIGTCTTDTLASAQHANQGTTTTVLHGNGSGNPAFGPVVSGDLNITGTTCTNQVISAISSAAAGTCHTVVGGDMASATVTATQLAAQYSKYLQCNSRGLGDGLNSIAAGTYLQTTCYNASGVTFTITGIKCFTDNNGSSTLSATNGAGTALLTGAVTCTTAYASGTQGATVTIASADFIKFTFIADGTSKQTDWAVLGTF